MVDKKKNATHPWPCDKRISCEECLEKAKEDGLANAAKAIAEDLEDRFIDAWENGTPLFDDPAKPH